ILGGYQNTATTSTYYGVLGGGTYNLTKADSIQIGFSGIHANGGGGIDFSKAAKINYTSTTRDNQGDASSVAILATDNSIITLSNLTLNHTNAALDLSQVSNLSAIKAEFNSKISITNLALTTNVNGLTAQGTGSRIEVGGGLITVNSANAQVASSFTQGEFFLTNTSIEMSGDRAKAVVLSDKGGRATITGGKMKLQGTNSTVFLIKDSNLSVTGASIVTSGSDSYGLVIENLNSTTDAETQITLSDTTINASLTALLFRGGVETVDVVGGSLTGVNAIGVSDASRSANLTVNTNDTLLTGNVGASAGAILDLNMVGSDVTKSILTGAIINARNVNIDPSTWNITGNSDAVNLTNDRSDFRFVNDGMFKTLTVTNYTGVGAANVYLNTRLQSNDVDGTSTDKIVVRDGGHMSGNTSFHINNVGGVGAGTTDGILFVDAQGSATIDKTNFKLAGGSVTAGAYAYVARQGQYSHLTSNSQDLFLTNYIPEGGTVDANGFIVDPKAVIPPIIPPVVKPEPKPVLSPNSFSADFVTYNAIADVVSWSASTLLGTYHERMGVQNTRLVQAEKASTFNTDSWGRLVADTREVAYDNAALNQSIKGTTAGFQVGHSIWQGKNANNTTSQAGVAIGYVKGSMDVSGDFAATKNSNAGTVDADTTALMGYYTLASNDGLYVDAVLQYSLSKADAQGTQSNLSLDSKGLRGSLEIGIPFQFGRVTVEPQGQIVAYKDSFDDAVDSKGYAMSQDDSSGVVLRLGARITSNDTTAAFKPWFAANLNLQNASTGTGVNDLTNQVGLDSKKDAVWVDMSVGMSYQTRADLSIYGHLKQSVAIDGGTNTTTSGAIGIQKTW
ncbi:MAG: autotransporter outer membrane beta-barrel domain-containing protein, partial [Neisseriaceae bacterium]|nr:autotransporter outer membrane beta-barrel domain-containing protein [Neisseriaceae bacterium]